MTNNKQKAHPNSPSTESPNPREKKKKKEKALSPSEEKNATEIGAPGDSPDEFDALGHFQGGRKPHQTFF